MPVIPCSPTPARGSDLADTVNLLIRARERRNQYFSKDLFADPAWDMMLHLFAAEIAHGPMAAPKLCDAAVVPHTTALRWIQTLEQNGLLVRRSALHNVREACIELSPGASQALRRYFADSDE